MTERELQEQVLELARYTGWRAYHTFDSRRSEPGFPDLVLVRPPKVMFVELKSKAGRVTTEQAQWLEELFDCDEVETHIWRPEDWPAVERALNREPAKAAAR